MSILKCSCVGCDNIATHTWSGHPTCDSCGIPSRINETVKPFDITAYEFSDLEVGLADVNGDWIQINMVDGSRPPILNKRDAIAIAKALGVTAQDLK